MNFPESWIELIGMYNTIHRERSQQHREEEALILGFSETSQIS